ncbi:hypothetical protein [Blastococcus sp. URHD0036]|uniref:hypothetical protein n=1 Tax=Blastococcus sp. URHD0036 TaxID=1380356 RepID=UPI000494F181|nr:hypothetical protein [Blastococcus sp. URHD0036]
MLGVLVGGLITLGSVPALAVDDPTRPDVRVTQGPSCRPGGVAVEVTGALVAYDVVLATTRRPGGEDRARVDPGQTVQLTTGDVAWGETIDSRVLFTALDGSGATSVDELEGFEFTRPAEADCAAIAPPTGPATVPPVGGPSDAGTDDLPPDGVLPEPPARPAVSVASSDRATGVAAGEVLTVTASGFAAGEDVVLRLADGTELGASVADIDGLVVAEVTIPDGARSGATSLVVVGAVTSTTVAVDLQIAAATTPVAGGAVWPLAVAGVALVAAVAGLGLSTLRRRAARPPSGSA